VSGKYLPLAEAVFLHLVEKTGLQNQIEVDSAGTGDWCVGSAPHPGTQSVLEEAGIEYSGEARQITPQDLNDFDYIITMDDENLRYVRELEKRSINKDVRVAPLLEFSEVARQDRLREVPDPYLVGGFDIVYRLINSGCKSLLETIRIDHRI